MDKETKEQAWWLYLPCQDGACALLVEGGAEAVETKQKELDEAAAWQAERLARKDYPQAVHHGISFFNYFLCPSAPIGYDPSVWAAEKTGSFTLECTGQPFDAWEPQVLSAVEARREFGLKPEAAGEDMDEVQFLGEGTFCVNVHGPDNGWIIAEAPVAAVSSALEQLAAHLRLEEAAQDSPDRQEDGPRP